MKVYRLERKQLFKRNPDEVFAFFERPENLARITPDRLGFVILTPQPIEMKSGAVIDYTIKLLGIPIHWRTLITEYEKPNRFVDIQLKGPYSYWHHEHKFEPTDDGTMMYDIVHYALPFGPLGRLVHFLSVKRQLQHIFDFRARIIEQEFISKGKIENG